MYSKLQVGMARRRGAIGGARAVLFAVALLGVGASGSASACQGQELQRTKQLIDYAMNAGVQIAYMNDFNMQLQALLEMSQRLNANAQQLPYSCQALIQQWSGAIQAATGGQKYNGCMGGVCCDSTGCY